MASGRARNRAGLAAALLLALVTIAGSRAAMDPKRDFAVDLSRYAGLWHEIARVPNRFQDNEPRQRGRRFSVCTGTTAEYALSGEGRIAVTNACVRRAADGTEIRDVTKGAGRVVEGSKNRRLLVAFGPPIARFFQRLLAPSEGNYRIHCLGPEVDGRYSWSVVSGHRGKMAWFLAREPSVSAEVKSEMIDCAREAGLPVDKLVFRQGEGPSPA